MSSHYQDASCREADELFRTFLRDTSLSEADKVRRESGLLSLPTHLQEASEGRVKNVVLFPFGTAYHGIGFKDDPLTIFVAKGVYEGKKGKKKGMSCSKKL